MPSKAGAELLVVADDQSATYDERNRLTTMTGGGTTTNYSWTLRGTLTATTNSTDTTSYQFDDFERLMTATAPDGTTISYTYDGLDRLVAGKAKVW